MILTIDSFPPPPPTYTAFERLHQLHPAKADRAFQMFLVWATERRRFISAAEQRQHDMVRRKAMAFMTARPGAEQAVAVIDLTGEYAAWREEMAISTLAAEGIDVVTCNQESA